MRVESIGLPGSGKSTLAAATIKALNQAGHSAIDPNGLDAIDQQNAKGLPVLRRNERSRQAIYFAMFVQSHSELYRHFHELYHDTVRNLALITAVGADLAKYDGAKDHFDSFWADEGFLHQLAHAVLYASDWKVKRALERLPDILALVPNPTLTIYTELSTDASVDSLLRRMAGKGGRNEKAAKKRFENSFGGQEGTQARGDVLNAIADGLEARGARVFRIKGQQDLAKMTAETVQAVAPGLIAG